MSRIPVFVITGPTAAGKTAMAIAVAQAVGGEIVSADSMAVYRGMDIGTAKPTRQERRSAVFHLIDYVDPAEPYSLHRWLQDCHAALRDIWSRGKLPIVCGGTGLYIEALMEGFHLPPTDAEEVRRLRADLQRRLEREGLAALVAELRRLDPAAVSQVDIYNPRRVIRAIEIVRLTGRPLAQARSKASGSQRYLFSAWLLTCPRRVLNRRIDRRVDVMLARGWLDEVRGLLGELRPGTTALQAIGYRHLVAFLIEGGSWQETVRAIKRDTRRYAKRQETWWRRHPEIPRVLWETRLDFAAAELLLTRAARQLLVGAARADTAGKHERTSGLSATTSGAPASKRAAHGEEGEGLQSECQTGSEK